MNLQHSQNFLRNPKLVRELIQKSSLRKEDTVLDIGAGKGIITELLAKSVKSVIAIEPDTNLYSYLQDKFKEYRNVRIQKIDFLKSDLPKEQYKVFSNIPFSITADIIKKLLGAQNSPEDSYLIVQEEAAKKYAGKPYAKETLLSILHKPWFSFSVVHKFRRNDFAPTPQVNSVLLRIEKLKKPLISHHTASLFKDFVAFGFTSVRPNLKKGYKNVFGHIQFLKLADEFNFSPDAKPTDLDFGQWLGIFNYFAMGVEKRRQKQVVGAVAKLAEQQKSLDKIHRTRTARNWQNKK